LIRNYLILNRKEAGRLDSDLNFAASFGPQGLQAASLLCYELFGPQIGEDARKENKNSEESESVSAVWRSSSADMRNQFAPGPHERKWQIEESATAVDGRVGVALVSIKSEMQ
jgi:hypothetical protein